MRFLNIIFQLARLPSTLINLLQLPFLPCTRAQAATSKNNPERKLQLQWWKIMALHHHKFNDYERVRTAEKLQDFAKINFIFRLYHEPSIKLKSWSLGKVYGCG